MNRWRALWILTGVGFFYVMLFRFSWWTVLAITCVAACNAINDGWKHGWLPR